MRAIVDDYGEIGRRLAAMELERRYPLMMFDPGGVDFSLAPGALNYVLPGQEGPAEAMARYEVFKRMREVEERPITQYMSLEAIREAARLLMGSMAENG